MHLHPQAHGSHSFLIPIFDVSVLISLHHLLHHFCLKPHHFPIKYDTLAFSPKSRKPLKTLHFSAFSEVLKRSKHKLNKFLLVCFHNQPPIVIGLYAIFISFTLRDFPICVSFLGCSSERKHQISHLYYHKTLNFSTI